MDQSLYIIRENFFNNPYKSGDYVLDLINSNCYKEKILLLYDPLSEKFFTHLATYDKSNLELKLKEFYNNISNSKDVLSLKWYQLNDSASFHLTFLTSLLFSISSHYGVYLLCCFPLDDTGDLHLYCLLNRYAVSFQSDIYLLFRSSDYEDHLSTLYESYNASITDSSLKFSSF